MYLDMLNGKGLYIWKIAGLPLNWVEEFKAMDISWIAIKVADGVNSFNLRWAEGIGWVDDILPGFVATARANGFRIIVWQYVYGFNPRSEADKAAQRINKCRPEAFIIDAEHQYYNKPTEAAVYMKTLRGLVDDLPIGLSSYRRPDMHPVPYKQFLDMCHFNAPQVYWNENRASFENKTCYDLYKNIMGYEMPYIPAGRSYDGEGFPMPTVEETNKFLASSKELGSPGAFFWRAGFMLDRRHNRYQNFEPIRKAIGDYPWKSNGDNGGDNGDDKPKLFIPQMQINICDKVYFAKDTEVLFDG